MVKHFWLRFFYVCESIESQSEGKIMEIVAISKMGGLNVRAIEAR